MKLYTRVHGEGPPVVLLHGLFGSGENLGAIARVLAGGFTVHAMDLRNHGRSPHGERMAYATLAGDVLDTMDAHRLGAAALVGHSMGGKTAMEIALTSPERASRVAILDIAPVEYARRHDRELDALARLDPAALKSRADADRALADAIPEGATRQFLLKNLIRGDRGFGWRIPLDTIAEQYPQLVRPPSQGRYEGPILFIRGGRSDYIRDDHGPAIRERFPGARIETIADATHWVHIDAPGECSGILHDFLSGR